MNYFKQHGQDLLRAGYEVLPIRPGEKRPALKNWESLLVDKKAVADWSKQFPSAGLGIRTTKTPAVDIDVRDAEIVEKIIEWCQEHIGRTIARVGYAPKTLMVYRTEKPFTKLSSKKYRDWQGLEHRIEILGDGQQFVAFHVHPDTGKPYEWIGESALDIPASRLPVLTVELAQELIAYFESIVPEDWELASNGKHLPALKDDESFLANFKAPGVVTREQIELELEYISPDDYETWVQVGMALHHQWNGWGEGLEIWDQWSQKSDKYVGAEETQAKWESFTTGSIGVTIGTVFFLAEQGKKAVARQRITQWEQKIQACADYLVLMDDIAPQIGKLFSYDPGVVDLFTERIKKRAKDITGAPVRVDVVRKAMTPKLNLKKPLELYPWLEGWVYDLSTETFFHLEKKQVLTERAFNALYDRLLLTEQDKADGTATPVNRAAMTALNLAPIPTVDGVRYLPGAAELFTFNGRQVANSYLASSGAQVPAFLSPEGKEAVDLFKRHIAFLIEGAYEQQMLVDFLSYIVQNPGKRINWAVLLQGPEGNGKSYFHGLMSQVLGPENVGAVAGRRLEGQWTDWAEGNMLTCIEEVKFQGHNRYDALNSLKPYITNDVIEITKKHQSSYLAPNTSSYLMFTNYQDSLPLDSADSRYFVIFSRLKTKEEVDQFAKEHPDYFSNLFQKTYTEAGAIRRWMLERELSPAFNAQKRAPQSEAKAYMIDLARSEDELMLEEIMETSGDPFLTSEVLSSNVLLNVWRSKTSGHDVPQTARMNRLLSRLGFQKVVIAGVDRFKLGGSLHRFWSKDPGAVTHSQLKELSATRKDLTDFD